MSKLSAIIDAATADTTSVAALLRMIKVVAARIQTPLVVDWVDNELAGYSSEAPLPDYRGPFQTQVLSEWSGFGGSQIRNAPLAPSAFPQGLRDAGAFEVEFRESVSELERLATSDGLLSYFWPTDVIALINGMMQNGQLKELQQFAPLHGLVAVHKRVSPALLTSVLDSVRTRVLSLALDLEQVMPDAGEPGVVPVDPAHINNIITNYFSGPGTAVAFGGPATVQLAEVRVGDLESLLDAAATLGLQSAELAELREAIRNDEADKMTPADGPGRRVTQFLGKAALGGLKSMGQAGIQECVKILGEWIRAYHGVG